MRVRDHVLETLAPEQLRSLRRQNDNTYRRWPATRVIALHERTLRETKWPDEYVAGVKRHVASGLYRAIYPPAFVEATRTWLAKVDAARARAGMEPVSIV